VRPLLLTIEGLTSFKTQQTVDLSELDLFVITGPTGSGKSSVLDAITFALFGSIARIGSHELRDLISHGSSYMRVCLDFQVDGTHYRVARRMGRASHQATLERIENGSSVTEVEQGGIRAVNQRLEQIVGLDFKAFTKAVLLPQGAFDEFLKGDVSERRRILVRLLDLGRYDAAGQAARQEGTRLDAIIGERRSLIESNYADATQERLQELQSAITAARDRHAKIKQLEKDGKLIADQASEVERTETALIEGAAQVEDALGALDRAAETWPELEAEERSAKEELKQTEKALGEARQALAKRRTELEATARKTGDADLLARLESAAITYTRERAELEKLDGELTEAHKLAAQLSEAHQLAEAREPETRAALQVKIEAREQAEARQQLAEAILRCADAQANVASLDERHAAATKEATTASAKAEEARTKLRHLEQEHAAVALRAGLAPGDRCPVCDSVIEALPKRDRDLAAILRKAQKAVEAASKKEQSTTNAVVALEARRSAASEELEQARKALPKRATLTDQTEAKAALAQAHEAVLASRQEQEAAERAVEGAVKEAADAKTTASNAATKAEAIASNRRGADERLQTALATLTATFKKLPQDPTAEIARRRDQLNAAEDAHRQAAELEETARLTHERAQQLRQQSAERVVAFDQELTAARTTAGIACASIARLLNDPSLPALPAEHAERTGLLQAWPLCCDGHLASARAALGRLAEELKGAATKLRSLALETDVAADSDDPAEILAAVEEAATSAHGVVVAAEKDAEALETRIGERAKLEQDIVDDRRLCALYQTLARDLRADHFVAFVLEESMSQLAAQASEELLQISDGRYSLVAEEGSFEVIDHHNADERRSVATLSGGETFLASLSLALALSAGLRELAGTAAGRLEAIFIDEGFGALDPETLDVVVDALERLREGERMVGVITHVPTLADRIPAGLMIQTNGNSSRIQVR
jgi:DNA repair protein SbcC/Rad50